MYNECVPPPQFSLPSGPPPSPLCSALLCSAPGPAPARAALLTHEDHVWIPWLMGPKTKSAPRLSYSISTKVIWSIDNLMGTFRRK